MEIGYIGSFRIGMSNIASTFKELPAKISRAHLAPNLEHLQAISTISGTKRTQLARLLFLFSQAVKPDPEVYKLSDLDDQIVLARVTDRYRNMDLTTRFTLSAAPVPLRTTAAVTAYEIMVAAVAKNRKLNLSKVLPDSSNRERGRLSMLETETKIVNLYSWLHYRFQDLFPDIEQAQRLRRELNQEINVILGRKGPQERHCSSCSKVLPERHTFNICDKCHNQRRGGGGQSRGKTPNSYRPARRSGGRQG